MIEGSPLGIAAGAWWVRACDGLKVGRMELTQRQLAATIGTGQGTFCAYERSFMIPRMRKATAWAGALGYQLALTRGAGRLRQQHTVWQWNTLAGRDMAALRNLPAPAGHTRTHTQRSLAAAAGMALATVQAVEAGRDVHVTTWAVYVFAIGWAPVLLGPDGEPACHTRGPGGA